MYRSTSQKLCTVLEHQKPRQKSRNMRQDKHKKEKKDKNEKQEAKKKKNKKLFVIFLLIPASLKIETAILSSTVLEDVTIRDPLSIFSPIFLSHNMKWPQHCYWLRTRRVGLRSIMFRIVPTATLSRKIWTVPLPVIQKKHQLLHRGKLPKREANYWFPSNAEVFNERCLTCAPPECL